MEMNADSKEQALRVALISSTRTVFGLRETSFSELFPEVQILHLLDETLI
jgi:hypothetical protein